MQASGLRHRRDTPLPLSPLSPSASVSTWTVGCGLSKTGPCAVDPCPPCRCCRRNAWLAGAAAVRRRGRRRRWNAPPSPILPARRLHHAGRKRDHGADAVFLRMRALAGMSELLMLLPLVLAVNIGLGLWGIAMVNRSWRLVVLLGANRNTDVRWMAGANVALELVAQFLPQLSSCGPIEASLSLRRACCTGSFRNCQVAAPLKLVCWKAARN